MKNFVRKHRTLLIIIGVILVLIVGFSLLRRGNGQTAQSQYETVTAQKQDLSATVGATGTVRSNQTAALTWETTGTVQAVNVKVGDKVQTGDVLATLDPTTLPQNVILAQADLLSAQRQLEDLKNSNTARAQAEQAVADAEDALKTAQDKYDSMFYPRASDELIRNTQAKINLAKLQVTKSSDTYRHFINKRDGNPDKAQALADLTNAQINLNNLIAQYNWYTGHYTQVDIDKAKSALDVAKAQLSDAQRNLDRLQNGVDSLDLTSAQVKVTAAQATLNLAQVQAPFDGTITDVQPLPGDLVSAGVQAFRMDDLSHLLVDVQVSEIDINSIQVDQPVSMTFDAILGKTYHGKVIEVGQVGDVNQGAVNFNVTVEITDADAEVKPGMTAAVTVLVKQLKDVLTVPNRAVRIVDNQRVVYILKNGVPTMVNITLGANSDTDSQVLSGDLSVGDQIILNPPATFGNSGGGAQFGSNSGG